MSTQPKTVFAPEEYLAIERGSEQRSEYYDGEMFAMGGASSNHVLIVSNLVRVLGNDLNAAPCRVYASDLRLCVSPSGLYTYPDVIVVCGDPRYLDDKRDTLLNPCLIIEVLSDSTENYDRGRKFEHYRSLDSLKEYVLVAQDKPHVEVFVRQGDRRWVLSEFSREDDVIALDSVACSLPLKEIYHKVELP